MSALVLFLSIAAASSYPDWWWTKGPGLPDPPVWIKALITVIALGGGAAVGLAINNALGENQYAAAGIAAFAGGRIIGGIAKGLTARFETRVGK